MTPLGPQMMGITPRPLGSSVPMTYHGWSTRDSLWHEPKGGLKLPFWGNKTHLSSTNGPFAKKEPARPKKNPNTSSRFANATCGTYPIHNRTLKKSEQTFAEQIYQNCSSAEPAGIWDWIYPGFSSGFRHVLPCVRHSPLYSNHLPQGILMAMCQSTRLGVRIGCTFYQLCS